MSIDNQSPNYNFSPPNFSSKTFATFESFAMENLDSTERAIMTED